MQVKQSASWKDLHWIHLGCDGTSDLPQSSSSHFLSFPQRSSSVSKSLWLPHPTMPLPPPIRSKPQPALSGKLLFLSSAASIRPSVCLSIPQALFMTLSVRLSVCLCFCQIPLLRKSDSFGHAHFVGEIVF